MDIAKIIKDIKYLKTLTHFKLDPDLETKFTVHHCHKNVIDLDKLDEFYHEEKEEKKKQRAMTKQKTRLFFRKKKKEGEAERANRGLGA